MIPLPGVLDLPSRRYRDLVAQLGEERARRRGWKSEVARLLDVHPSHISRIVGGTQEIGRDAINRACSRLGLSEDFFTTPAARSPAYAGFIVRGDGTRGQGGEVDRDHELDAMGALVRLGDAERSRVLAWAAGRWPGRSPSILPRVQSPQLALELVPPAPVASLPKATPSRTAPLPKPKRPASLGASLPKPKAGPSLPAEGAPPRRRPSSSPRLEDPAALELAIAWRELAGAGRPLSAKQALELANAKPQARLVLERLGKGLRSEVSPLSLGFLLRTLRGRLIPTADGQMLRFESTPDRLRTMHWSVATVGDRA